MKVDQPLHPKKPRNSESQLTALRLKSLTSAAYEVPRALKVLSGLSLQHLFAEKAGFPKHQHKPSFNSQYRHTKTSVSQPDAS